ncbi:small-conductance mechanosensitive channel [gamma proteobacterium HTCC5015]|nr:small-conductance mechanosensitive channel [gamma proteobacterium HTCC5015]
MLDFLQLKGWFDIEGFNGFFDDWRLTIFALVLGTVLFNFVLRLVIHHIANGLTKTENKWDDAFVHALSKPISLLVWIIGLSLAIEILHSKTGEALYDIADPMRRIGLVVCIIWFLVRGVKNTELNVIEAGRRADPAYDPTTAVAMSKLGRLSLVITGSLVGLESLGVSVSGVLAFGGVGGIAVGFAARDMLANFFGGLMIYLDRPFSVGEWVRSPDRNIEGTVEDIGLRITRIRTFDKRPLYVPNAIFTNIVVENPSRMFNRRISESIGVRYDDLSHVKNIVADIRSMLENHEDIDQEETLIVNFDKFNSSSLDIMLYTFTKTTNWVEYHKVRQAVLLAIADIIEEYGAEIAFPTRTLHMPDGLQFQSFADAAKHNTEKQESAE